MDRYSKYKVSSEIEIPPFYNEDGTVNEETYRLLFEENLQQLTKKQIKFKHFPHMIKEKIKFYLFLSGIYFVLAIASFVYYLIYIPVVDATLTFFMLGLIPFGAALGIYGVAKNRSYRTFRGVVVSNKLMTGFGIGKNKYYRLITLSDEVRFLSFKYPETTSTKKLEKGDAVTVFFPDNTAITYSEGGPLIDHYLSIEFSGSTDFTREEFQKKENKLTFEEFMAISEKEEKEEERLALGNKNDEYDVLDNEEVKAIETKFDKENVMSIPKKEKEH